MMTAQRFRTQSRDGGAAKPKVQTVSAAVDWLGVDPTAHLAMKDKPLRYSRWLMESQQRPKKPDPSLL
jgi:hypothetical protein